MLYLTSCMQDVTIITMSQVVKSQGSAETRTQGLWLTMLSPLTTELLRPDTMHIDWLTHLLTQSQHVKCHLSCILYLLMSRSRNNDDMCIRATFLCLLQDNTLVLMLLLPFAGTFRHKRCCLCERWGKCKWDAW